MTLKIDLDGDGVDDITLTEEQAKRIIRKIKLICYSIATSIAALVSYFMI